MQDLKALLDQFLGQSKGTPSSTAGHGQGQTTQGSGGLSGLLGGGGGGLATGAIAGSLMAMLTSNRKKARKFTKSSLKLGGIALIGGLAYKAWQNWQANQAPTASSDATLAEPPRNTAFLPSGETEQQDLSRTLLRAMVAAAKADGHVSSEERERINKQLETLDLDFDDRAFLEAELAQPVDVDAIAKGAKNPEQAAEIYTASLLAIDPDGPAERGYLAMLAARLQLHPELVKHLHAQADAIFEPA